MRKFECNACGRNCMLEISSALDPKHCVLFSVNTTQWQEVKEENTQVKLPEQPSNPRMLPDWVKVGEWVYDTTIKEYACIKKEESKGWYFEHIEDGTIIQARKRPFNAEEMKALVGKVVEHKKNLHLVTNYLEDSTDNTPYVCVGTNWREAKGLIEHGYTIDGKPCYVLEHLNDKGEWVE